MNGVFHLAYNTSRYVHSNRTKHIEMRTWTFIQMRLNFNHLKELRLIKKDLLRYQSSYLLPERSKTEGE